MMVDIRCRIVLLKDDKVKVNIQQDNVDDELTSQLIFKVDVVRCRDVELIPEAQQCTLVDRCLL